MDITVQFRGFRIDYCFQKESSSGRPIYRADAEWTGLLEEKAALIDHDPARLVSFQTLLLYRQSNRLRICISSLPTSLQDNGSRPLRSMVTVDAPDTPQNDTLYRSLAVRAITDGPAFAAAVAATLSHTDAADNPTGYVVDWAKLRVVLQQRPSEMKSGTPPHALRHTQFTTHELKRLADELRNHRLPNHEGVLVLVTPFSKMNPKDVWRLAGHLEEEPQKKNGHRSTYSKLKWAALPMLLLMALIAYAVILNRPPTHRDPTKEQVAEAVVHFSGSPWISSALIVHQHNRSK